jgi:hypothetical protein
VLESLYKDLHKKYNDFCDEHKKIAEEEKEKR